MGVGPKRHGKPRAKVNCGLGMYLWRPKWWISTGKTIPECEGQPEVERPPSYDAAGTSTVGFPEMLASFDPHDIDPREFKERFRARRLHERQRRSPHSNPTAEEQFDDAKEAPIKE